MMSWFFKKRKKAPSSEIYYLHKRIKLGQGRRTILKERQIEDQVKKIIDFFNLNKWPYITLIPDVLKIEQENFEGRFRKYTLRLLLSDYEHGSELMSISGGSINGQFKQFMKSEKFSDWSFSKVR